MGLNTHYTCDRCGNFLGENDEIANRLGLWVSRPALIENPIGFPGEITRKYLCQSCQDSFDVWWTA